MLEVVAASEICLLLRQSRTIHCMSGGRQLAGYHKDSLASVPVGFAVPSAAGVATMSTGRSVLRDMYLEPCCKPDASSCCAMLGRVTLCACEGAACFSSCLASNAHPGHALMWSCPTLQPLGRQRHHRRAGAIINLESPAVVWAAWGACSAEPSGIALSPTPGDSRQQQRPNRVSATRLCKSANCVALQRH